MCLEKGLPQLTSSKVVFRTFLATVKQTTQSYSSCTTDCQHDFEKGKHLEQGRRDGFQSEGGQFSTRKIFEF